MPRTHPIIAKSTHLLVLASGRTFDSLTVLQLRNLTASVLTNNVTRCFDLLNDLRKVPEIEKLWKVVSEIIGAKS